MSSLNWELSDEERKELENYPRPVPVVVPPDHNVPDALVKHGYVFDWETDRKMHGFVVQLLTPKAYEAFPEALTDGPTKGLLWFKDQDLGNLCALESRLDLVFSGIV